MENYGIMDEAKRLYSLGLGIHWIRPGSKAPIKTGWAAGERQSWQELEATFKKGYGLGMRLGRASKLNKDLGYVSVIDVDIKSKTESTRLEALSVLDNLYPGLIEMAPTVETGNGFHLLIRTKMPLTSRILAKSKKKCKVKMPTAPITDEQRALLSQKEIDSGIRVRRAWQIELLSDKRQSILPPSIHPDTKKPYRWKHFLEHPEDIPLIAAPKYERPSARDDGEADGSAASMPGDWRPQKIDLEISNIPPKWISAIVEGEGVENASDALFSAFMVLSTAGYSDHEILSILTDPKYFLGRVAYRHRKTKNRRKAADWLWRYGLKKAKRKASPEAVFKDAPVETDSLTDVEVEKQQQELIDWRSAIKRNKRGEAYGTYAQALMVLENEWPKLFAWDEFKTRQFLAQKSPFGKEGDTLSDPIVLKVKEYLVKNWQLEIDVKRLNEVIATMAHSNVINSAKQFFESLPLWDGRERLGTWLTDHFGAEDDPAYVGEVFTKWLSASVARVYEPGMKFDEAIIFEGAQGIGKGLFGRILFGKERFSHNLPAIEGYTKKDAMIHLQGKLCIELGELSIMRRSTVTAIKDFLSSEVDEVRVPYGHHDNRYPRQCVFYGTTNESRYLIDETGNRRFNPICVGKLDVAQLEKDREQLWAEAYYLSRNGLIDRYWLSDEIQEYAKELREEKREFSDADPFLELMNAFLFSEQNFNWERFSLLDLFSDIGPFAGQKFDKKNMMNAGKILRKLGAKKWMTNGKNVWHLPPEIIKNAQTSTAPTGVMLN